LLLLNQFPDAGADRAAGRRHLIIVYGFRVAAAVYSMFNAAAFLSLAAGVALQVLPSTVLIGLATLPLAALASRGAFVHGEDVSKLVPSLAMNVASTLLTPLLVAAGMFFARR
jgi:1,4-dihydroxy-2-naphthoate octaprenyltransferase